MEIFETLKKIPVRFIIFVHLQTKDTPIWRFLFLFSTITFWSLG